MARTDDRRPRRRRMMEMDSRLPSEGSSQASSAPTTLSSLSDDVLVHIVREGLGVYDVIAVRRMNRRLHGFTKLRSVWFALLDEMRYTIPLPIDFPPPNTFDAEMLERIAVKTMQLSLDLNTEPVIPMSRSIRREGGTYFLSMKVVSCGWLFTVQAVTMAPDVSDCEEFILKGWKISEAGEVQPAFAEKVVYLNDHWNSLCILDAQFDGDDHIMVALQAHEKTDDDPSIDRLTILFSRCHLPTPTSAGSFDNCDQYATLAPFDGEDIPEPECVTTMPFSMHKDLFAFSGDWFGITVANKRCGTCVRIEGEGMNVVQVCLVGSCLFVVAAEMFHIYRLPEAILSGEDRVPFEGEGAIPLQILPHEVICLSTVADGYGVFAFASMQHYISNDSYDRYLGDGPWVYVNIFILGGHDDGPTNLFHYRYQAGYNWIFAPELAGPNEETVAPSMVSKLPVPEGTLWVDSYISAYPGPLLLTACIGATGRRLLWHRPKHGQPHCAERLQMYVEKARRTDGDRSTWPETTLMTPVDSDEFLRTLKIADRTELQNASCFAFDEARGHLVIGTSRGRLYVMSYAEPWPTV